MSNSMQNLLEIFQIFRPNGLVLVLERFFSNPHRKMSSSAQARRPIPRFQAPTGWVQFTTCSCSLLWARHNLAGEEIQWQFTVCIATEQPWCTVHKIRQHEVDTIRFRKGIPSTFAQEEWNIGIVGLSVYAESKDIR